MDFIMAGLKLWSGGVCIFGHFFLDMDMHFSSLQRPLHVLNLQRYCFFFFPESPDTFMSHSFIHLILHRCCVMHSRETMLANIKWWATQHTVCEVLYTNCLLTFLAALWYPYSFYNKETEAQEGKMTTNTQPVRNRCMARGLRSDFKVLQKGPFFLEVVHSLVAIESLQSVKKSWL